MKHDTMQNIFRVTEIESYTDEKLKSRKQMKDNVETITWTNRQVNRRLGKSQRRCQSDLQLLQDRGGKGRQ